VAERSREEAIELIRQMMSLTFEKGAMPGEVEQATKAVKRLLDKYQLSLLDVESGRYKEAVEKSPWDVNAQKMPNWWWLFTTNLSVAYDCRVIQSSWRDLEDSFRRKIRVIIVGHSSDVEVFWYMHETLYIRLLEMAVQEGKEQGYRGHGLNAFKGNYLAAASYKIRERIAEMRNPKTAVAEDRLSETTSLIHIKQAAVEEFVNTEWPELRHISRDINWGAGTQEGLAAGQNIELIHGMPSNGNGESALPSKTLNLPGS